MVVKKVTWFRSERLQSKTTWLLQSGQILTRLMQSEEMCVFFLVIVKQIFFRYDRVALFLLNNIDSIAVLFATHNEETVKKIVDLMEKKKVDSKRVAFGQLLGMCDHVSLSLGKAGYLVYKYVPYGPVKVKKRICVCIKTVFFIF
jgi:hypothetical protein